MTPLEILEEGAKEAEAALEDLKALWEREDEATKANRAAVLEAHAQGARDRDEARRAMGGVSAPPAPEAVAEPTLEAAADRPRASSLPVTPLAALDQDKKKT
jgi:hypothetical protein